MGEDLPPDKPPEGNQDFDDQVKDSARNVLEGDRELSAWEELGAGDPRKRRIEDLMIAIETTTNRIQQEYQPLVKGDKSIFKLTQALRFVVSACISYRAEDYVGQVVTAHQNPKSQRARHDFVRAYDSLGLLLNAYDFTLPIAETGQPDEFLLEQFTQAHAPSQLWENADLNYELIQAVESSYRLIGEKSAPNPNSIRGFIIRLRLEIVRQGLGWKIPPRGTTAYANYKNNLKRLSREAWREFENDTAKPIGPGE